VAEDDAACDEIARLLVAGEVMTATEACRKLYADRWIGGSCEDSAVKRVFRRWRAVAAERLAKARGAGT
jgi:hypothetical protein